jgi:hypothetical protein
MIGCGEVGPNKSWRDDRYAQLVAGLLAQPLAKRANRELRGGIDRLIGNCLEPGGRRDGDEVPELLGAKQRQCRGDTIEDALDVDVDHVFPFVNAEGVEGRNRPDASVAHQDVQLTEALACQIDKACQIAAPPDIRDPMNGGATDAVGMSGAAVTTARAKDQFSSAFGEEKRRRLADSATRSRDGDHLAFHRHTSPAASSPSGRR